MSRREAGTFAVLGLATLTIGATSFLLALRASRHFESRHDSEASTLLNRRFFQCLGEAADLELGLQDRCSSSRTLGRVSLDASRGSSSPSDSPGMPGLSTVRTEIARLEDMLRVRARLMLDGEGRFADELYSVDYYTSVIRSGSSTPTERSSAFLHLSYLDNGRSYMAGLEAEWTVEALRAREDADILRLVAAAFRIPRSEAVKLILMREATSRSDLVRGEALRALAKYPDEDAWDMIRSGLDDGSYAVREEARYQLSKRR